MLLIEHRVNTVEHLNRTPAECGVEIDIRDYDGALRCVHDPLLSGEPLTDVLKHYRHALAVFNVKCDGLESRIMRLAEEHKIGRYFFLDCANPSLVQLVNHGVRSLAVRYSEYEPLEFALAFAGRAEWVWIDCFSRLPLDPGTYAALRKHFKLCIVSPELQRHPRAEILRFREMLSAMPVDAVCTDFRQDWL